jgi:hypothetical protein
MNHRLRIALLCLATALPAAANALTFSAEDYRVGRSTSGARTTSELDLRAEGRTWVRLAVAREGDWLQLHLPALAPGRYRVAIVAMDHRAAPACVVAIGEADGSNLQRIGELPAGSATESVHWTNHRFRRIDVGEVSLALPGFRTLRFTATTAPGGDDAAIGIDALYLTPIADPELVPPAGLRADVGGPVHAVLHWQPATAAGEASGFLIERRGRPAEDWTACGYAPAGARQFVAAGLYPKTHYSFRVRPWSPRGLGAASAEASVTTAAVDATWRGALIRREATPQHRRSGEGSIVALRDGRLLMFYNAQDRIDDFAEFAIFRMESADGGVTWSPSTPHLANPGGPNGYLMPSLLRLRDGSIGFSYARRDNRTLQAQRVYRVSHDDGATWSEETVITRDLPLDHAGYRFTGATGPHDRLIQAENGNLLLPFHLTTGRGTHDRDPASDRSGPLLVSATVVYRSADLGRTWARVFGPALVKSTLQAAPYPYHWIDQLTSEPGLVETGPGRFLLQVRNPSGFFYQARSIDSGWTWTPLHQSPINAPLSPARLFAVAPGVIGMAFNPWVDPRETNLGRRFALGTLLSRDEGASWEHFRLLDLSDPDERAGNFCYPYFHRDQHALHAFYFGGRGLDMTYRRLPPDWFVAP